jgi:hypothetical protein
MTKRAIVVNADHKFASTIVDKRTAGQLKTGDRVRVCEALEVDFYGDVRAGEYGTVVFVDHDEGLVEIEFDNVIESLRQWRNCLMLMAFDTPDWIGGFELVTAYEAKELGLASPVTTKTAAVTRRVLQSLSLAPLLGAGWVGPALAFVHAEPAAATLAFLVAVEAFF